jgi:site-specific recombinase XerD
VVGGSNPLTPTIYLASGNRHKGNKPPPFPRSVSKFVNTFVNTGEIRSIFFELLATLLKEYRLSDRTLAKQLGISPAYLSYLKRGKRPLNTELATRIVGVLPGLQELFLDTLNKTRPLYANTLVEDMKDRGQDYNLEEVIKQFIQAKQIEGCSKKTIIFYEQNLERFVWWAKAYDVPFNVGEITHRHLRSFLYYVQTTPIRWGIGSSSSRKLPSMSTVDAYWRTLQSLFSWLVREETIDEKENPLRKIPRPKMPKKLVEAIPLELIRQALDLWNPDTLTGARNRAIIMILLDTGVRLLELSNLMVSDIDIESGIISVWRKGGKQGQVMLGKMALGELRLYISFKGKYQNTPYLWIQKNGQPFRYVGIQMMIRRHKKLGGGCRWSPHTFRHTFALNYLLNGGDPFTLQILGGWEDLEMPRKYTSSLKAKDAFRVHQKASPGDHLMNINTEDSTE